MAGKSDTHKTVSNVNIRALALDILIAEEKGEGKIDKLLKAVLDKYDYLDAADKNFLKRLTEGTVEFRIKLDCVIDGFSKTPVAKMKPLIRQIMRMSVYQILFMDRVPDNAVCDEAVKLVKKRGLAGLSGFVNGVLRSIARGRDDIKWPDVDSDPVKALGIEYSCPEHIVRSLIDDYGRDRAKSCLEASVMSDRMTYVRIDESLPEDKIRKIISGIEGKRPEQEICHPELSEGSSDTDISDITDKMYYSVGTDRIDNVTRMSEFGKGLMTVQDISSQMVCEMAGFDTYAGRSGIKILDMCSAPGGKSMHAASKLNRYGIGGSILSLDISEAKQNITGENAARMHLEEYITTGIWDATEYNEEYDSKFDLVLADVPCSGLGVIGRKPDIKYNMTEDVMNDIAILQRKILDNAVRYVRPGGRLVFSTCTMRKAENDAGTEYILNKGGFSLIRKTQLFLSRYNDGFYIAVLERS